MKHDDYVQGRVAQMSTYMRVRHLLALAWDRCTYPLRLRWYKYVMAPGLTWLGHLWYQIGAYFGWVDELKSDY